MTNVLSQTTVQAALSLLALMIVCSVAYWVLAKWRDSSRQDQDEGDSLLKNFEEMRQEGDIDEKEFRNIQSLLQRDHQASSSS